MVGCNTELVAGWRCPPIYWRAAAGADRATPPTRTTQYTTSQQPLTNQHPTKAPAQHRGAAGVGTEVSWVSAGILGLAGC